jgi:hypothetical protein
VLYCVREQGGKNEHHRPVPQQKWVVDVTCTRLVGPCPEEQASYHSKAASLEPLS